MPSDHQRPTARVPEDATTATAPAPTHAERCRTLVAAARSATLCSIARDPAGYPYGSLVTLAIDGKGRPLLLLSTLAEHTQNLAARADASILVTEPLGQHAQPLALGRVTLLGPCQRIEQGDDRDEARRVFLAAQPDAASYVDFKDFAFHRLEPLALRYVGGFGRMSWVTAEQYRDALPDPLAATAAGILKHMNEDHADALVAYAKGLSRIADTTAATMTAVDRYGFEMAVTTPSGPRATRIGFDRPVDTPETVRGTMVELVKRARAATA
jgi:putative heme iron utilization protein